jgi:hypothetical protein
VLSNLGRRLTANVSKDGHMIIYAAKNLSSVSEQMRNLGELQVFSFGTPIHK